MPSEQRKETPWRGERDIGLVEIGHVFFMIGIMGFGGVGPITRQQIVDVRRWMSEEDFIALLGLCKLLPGPNTVNVAVMAGDRFAGLRGTLVALAALLVPPLTIAASVATLYGELAKLPQFASVIQGATAAAAGLVGGTAAKMALRARLAPRSLLVALAACGATAGLNLPLPVVLAVLGPLALAAAHVRGDAG